MNIVRKSKLECSIEKDEKVTVSWLRAYVDLIKDRDDDEADL